MHWNDSFHICDTLVVKNTYFSIRNIDCEVYLCKVALDKSDKVKFF